MNATDLANGIRTAIDRLLNPPWITGYVAAWKPLPSFGPCTHLVHAFAVPRADGTLALPLPGDRARFVAAVHAADRKALISLGGEGSQAGFRPALTLRLPELVANVGLLLAEGYDGVDVDFEPLVNAADGVLVAAFIRALRAAWPKAIITAATIEQPLLWATLAPIVDQINLMTYDLAGPWQGVSWHQGALYDGGVLQAGGQPVFSVESALKRFATVPQNKLGIGLSMNATIWSGVTGPNQVAKGATMKQQGVGFVGAARFDYGARAPYATGPGTFTSFDTAESIAEKAAFVRSRKLGGIMCWDLASATPAQVVALEGP